MLPVILVAVGAYLIGDSVIKDSKKYAKGGNTDTMKNIKDYYTNKYPTDELGVEINEKATFNGLYKVLDNEGDVYHYIGVQDSLVRERLFEKLSELMGVDYDVIYQKWLASDFEPMFEKGGYMAKGGEIKSGDKFYDKKEKQTIEVLKKADNFDFYYVKWQDGLETPYTTSNIKFLVEKGLWEKMEKGGYMAKGGSTKNIKSNKDLTIEEISSMTGLRKEGIERFSDEYELTDSDLSNIMQGLGRKMISSDDFSTAVVGNKDNSYAKEIVDFAKSGKGYKKEKGGYMAKGGKTAKNRIKRDGEHLMHFEPYFEKEVIVASIDDKAKTIRPSQGYFYPNAIGKKSINWAKKNGFKFIQDGKEF